MNYVGWFRYLLRSFEGHPFTMALVASGTATHVSSALLRTFADPQAIATSRVPVTLPLDTICAELNQLQPNVVFGYPTAHEITDEITRLDGTCPCGSAHRLIADVQGRLDDSFRYPGGVVVHPHVFRSPLGRERAIIEYQVRQTKRGAAISLICAGEVDLTKVDAAITEGLCALHLSAPEVTFDVVACLDRQETGKLRRFLPLPS